MLELNKIHQGDCLELMKDIPDKSIDMILCDLPYGTTACKWDSVIPFPELWNAYERVIKDNGVILLTGKQPFTSKIIASNEKQFKYEMIWKKTKATNFMNAKKQPQYKHENICVFYKSLPTYNPQMRSGKPYNDKRDGTPRTSLMSDGVKTSRKPITNKGTRYPDTVIEFGNGNNNKQLHPTQKPVALFEYLIKTYTNEGETVLDNCIGSGTTAIASLNTGRSFIGIEKEQEYVDIANRRIQEHITK